MQMKNYTQNDWKLFIIDMEMFIQMEIIQNKYKLIKTNINLYNTNGN